MAVATALAIAGLAVAIGSTAVSIQQGKAARRDAESAQRKQIRRQNAEVQRRRTREGELRRFAGIRASRARQASEARPAPRGSTIMTSPTGVSTVGETPQSTKVAIGR